MALLQENQVTLPEFALIAEEFCLFIDSFRDGRPESLYTKLEYLLSELHCGILSVAKQMNEREDLELESFGEMTHEQWDELAKLIGAVIAEELSELIDRHIEINNGEYGHDAARVYTLWDDLADMYREIGQGLAQWKLGTVEGKVEASWQWRFGYESHWGHHLANAMKTVHELRYRKYKD